MMVEDIFYIVVEKKIIREYSCGTIYIGPEMRKAFVTLDEASNFLIQLSTEENKSSSSFEIIKACNEEAWKLLLGQFDTSRTFKSDKVERWETKIK